MKEIVRKTRQSRQRETIPRLFSVQKHFLFGYGSLINSESRRRNIESNMSIPSRVSGYSRSWSYQECSRKYTAVAVEPSNGTVNGVLIPLLKPESDLQSLDRREKRYIRKLVSLENVQILSKHTLPPLSIVWIYTLSSNESYSSDNSNDVNNDKENNQYPIPQTYIDCIIKGCLEHGPSFTREFLYSTTGWDQEMINDREFPASARKYTLSKFETMTSKHLKKIDALLSLFHSNRSSKSHSLL